MFSVKGCGLEGDEVELVIFIGGLTGFAFVIWNLRRVLLKKKDCAREDECLQRPQVNRVRRSSLADPESFNLKSLLGLVLTRRNWRSSSWQLEDFRQRESGEER